MVLHLPDSWSNWNLKMLVFEERGKPEYPGKTSQSKGENQQQTQPTYGVDARIWTWATLVGGERSHHRAIPCSSQQGEGWKICLYWQITTLHVQNVILYNSLPSLLYYEMKLPNFTSPLYGVGVHNTKIVAFFFKHNDRYGPKENFAKICQIKWN